MEKKTKIIIGLLILLILVVSIPILLFGSVVMWQLGVFSPAEGGVSSPSGGGMNRATGFVTVKSFDRTIQYAEDGTLSVVMTNAGGTTITDTELSFSEDCEGASYSISELAGGDTVAVSVDCTPKNLGAPFVTSVNITYTEEFSGQQISRTDSGRLTGTVG